MAIGLLCVPALVRAAEDHDASLSSIVARSSERPIVFDAARPDAGDILAAVAVAVALAWYGPQGLHELGEQCVSRAHYTQYRLIEQAGASAAFPETPFFKEFAVRLPADPEAVCDYAAAEGFLAGVPLRRLVPGTGLDDALLVAVTEKRSRDEIDALVDVVARACKEVS